MRLINKINKGFTIVEVMIVLAIAGAIMAIVFLAIPQVQRSSRNSQRRGIALRMKTEIEAYAANNQGLYPFVDVPATTPTTTPGNCQTSDANAHSCYEWYNNYVTGKFNITDPLSSSNVNIYYTNNVATPTPSPWRPGDVYIIVGGQCSGSSVTGTSGGLATSTKYAMLVELETSGLWTCVDNT